jgi:multidrug efflux pump subunit AcrA (membrane-fusion protein)
MRFSRLGTIGLVLAIANIFESRTADAQSVVRPFYRARYGYGYGYGHGAGNYANGMANIIRAQAQANLTDQQARSVSLDNQKKWAQNYFKMKEERQEYDARQREKNKPSPETLAAVAKSNLPRELGPEALDPVTGRITWPEVLQKSDYTAHRTELEQLFEQRVQTSQAAGTAGRIHAVTAEFAEQLRRSIEYVPAKEYMTGRKFLDSLDYAAHSHAG